LCLYERKVDGELGDGVARIGIYLIQTAKPIVNEK